ncbi:hypothetical protein FQR65_LT07495 [Abscondita terminalis]|nr:hypothetical protein FQR65_LT07495 [Abscondita terminalis]
MESKVLVTFCVTMQILYFRVCVGVPVLEPKLLPQTNTANLSTLPVKNEFYKTFPITISEDAILLVPELVHKYGYPCESHTVITSDGYILTMHRISHGRTGVTAQKRLPVYLQHGQLSSSADWLLAGPEKSLGYLLADAGYDVWMPNLRGNRYSRKHMVLSPDEPDFWKFTWHEMGLNDVTAMIDYVLQHTNSTNLHYIGHSMGTTVFYVMCSEKPEYNQKIKVQMSLAPIGFVDHSKSPLIRLLARIDSLIKLVTNLLGIHNILSVTKLSPIIGQLFCSDQSVTQFICVNLIFVLFGFNPKQMNATLLPVIMGHTPAGASTRQIYHYTQELNSRKFEKYDYGPLKNIALYNTIRPPSYVIEKITAPVYLHYSINDFLSSDIDVKRLQTRLPNVIDAILNPDSKFNHVDYLYGINAKKVLYEPLIENMLKYN